jgi:hypothetical protein
MNRRRAASGALFLALIAAVIVLPGVQLAGGPVERLVNGSFESGFDSTPLGDVGSGWHRFHNDGEAEYGYGDDTWEPVVYDGEHSQLIEINTSCHGGSGSDRYSGIYQTVAVVPGETYELSLRGMLRALEDDPDRSSYAYRVQYGIDYDGGTDWTEIDDWTEIPWDTVYPRLSPGPMESYSTSVGATGPRLTLFLRVWKKWSNGCSELLVNLDAVSLQGAMPADSSGPSVGFVAPGYPAAGWSYSLDVESSNGTGITKLELFDGSELVGSVEHGVGALSLSQAFPWKPDAPGTHILMAVAHDVSGAKASHQVTVKVGQAAQFLVNGDFEGGFAMSPFGEVGNGWGWFNNAGAAGYGYYDETWTPVVHAGQHSQLIEINSMDRAYADPDRYSGIYQTVDGLTPGATYELSMYGMLRALSDDADRLGSGYRVQWGFDPNGGTDWTVVGNWVDVPWDEVYPRLEPGSMQGYEVAFEAPSSQITLYIRAWKKWSTVDRELDVNLDSISLEGYE